MIAFARSPLDRADHVRTDPEALAGLMNWRARVLRLDGLMPALADDGGLLWGSLADCAPDAELVFLGLLDGKACFAPVPPAGENRPAYAIPQVWQMLASLPAGDLATYGGARSLVDWHARHRFCAQCGSGTVIAKGGWQRDCSACGAQHFPRTDPVTIMLVEHGGRLLLGRQPRFPPRRFSALAGFVEPGETIEEAVAREVLEEAGVRVRDVRYIASQPWPFPSQLMIGCHSMAEDDALTIDTTEIDEARWFSREEVAYALAGNDDGEFIAPPSQAIARHLLEWWLER
ncbi:NAD(+) diphosphatase [Tsuneonella sp. HG094]